MLKWLKRRTHSAPQIHEGKRVGSLTAASASLKSRSARSIRALSKNQAWQDAAWSYYDVISELHTGTNWLANGVSRATLYVGIPDPNGEGEPDPTDNAAVQDVLEQFFDGQAGHPEMLRRITLHLTIPGETWICGWNTDEGTEWRVASSHELKTSGQILEITPGYGEPAVALTEENSQVFRIWRPHARDGLQADSPTRSTLPICRELRGFDNHIAATTDSRLASAGILIVPASATTTSPGAGAGTDQTGEPFIESLLEDASDGLGDDDSSVRIVPSVARVPDGSVENFKHLTFSTPYDENIQTYRESAIKRMAVGMDMPIEILLGIGDTNHWNAWAIDEAAIKLHIEPMLAIICGAITEQYLRPALQGIVANPNDFVVWYDTSALAQRPNKGPEARELFDRDELSADALRRENGFNDDDAPSDEERKNRLLTKLLLASPDLAANVLPLLGLPPVSAPDFPQVDAVPVPESPAQIESSQPTRNEIPEQPLPESVTAAAQQSPDVISWQITVAEMATIRALEMAGRWMMGRAGRSMWGTLRHVKTCELYSVIPPQSLKESAKDETGQLKYGQMLENAYSALDEALPDSPCIKFTVDSYVRGLIRHQKPHSREKLADMLATAGCIGDSDV